MDFRCLNYRDLVLNRPYVPQSTLETDFPTPLYSDEYLTLRGPQNAPIIKEAVRWKYTPMGWDAIPQTWYTGLTNSHNHDSWYTLTNPIGREAYYRWQKSHAKRERTLPPAYAQHLHESSWYDPIVPAQYLDPKTRWGAFLWRDRPILGKEYVVNRNRCAEELKGKPGYVAHLSFHTPVFTAKDYRTWRMFDRQPSTNHQH
ncbi:tektin bundle-interacting protein 1 isoform X2 [Rhineura floridana]|uniref:tektin bundle-interacting protein 1 isoform X2 n=1 Tax=Rhineura floridana TaxID=261503 RepID=UPI002AC81AED|nr:tektin bundle-interacting protein 1 isoform X2 [Rhineura floridana]